MRSNKGVTIIMLVITIAIMAIIVSFAVFYSQNITPEAKLAKAYSSIKEVKDACDNALGFIEINPGEYDEYYFFGNPIQYTNSAEMDSMAHDCGLESGASFSDRTYVIAPPKTEEAQRILENLELKGVEDTYVVDLENEKYFLVGGAERIEGGKIYEYSEIIKAYSILVD